MPTSTLSQMGLSNIGPLTTVFTAPAACSTSNQAELLSFKPLWSSAGDEVPDPVFRAKCGPYVVGDCYPSGKKVEDFWAAPDPATDYGTMLYYSPASRCPHDHTTVGVAAKNGAGEISSSGIFVPPVVPATAQGHELWNPSLNVFMEALDKGETAVICCPRDYVVGEQAGWCYSEVPVASYGPLEWCEVGVETPAWTVANATFTYNDTVYTEVLSFTATESQSLYTTTSPIDNYEATDFVALGGRWPMTLVYKSAEETGAATGGATEGTAGPTETSPSAAHAVRMKASGGGAGVLAITWAVAALVGMAIVMPW